ncbi:hypothetical protein PQX77_010701 [Marasmius sp. AFHP31]|nr:hypothetical protein PQX77_010701 [Marasmius sp. AFHP31]
MFLWPLYKRKLMNPALRLVAKRTFIGAISGLTLFASNTIVLIAMGGHELDWVCMTSCVLDVTLNALILYWVSSGAPSDSITHFSIPELSTTGTTWGVDTLPPSRPGGVTSFSLSTMTRSRGQTQTVTLDLESHAYSGSDTTKSTGQLSTASSRPYPDEYAERKANSTRQVQPLPARSQTLPYSSRSSLVSPQTQSACIPRRRYSLS